MTEASASVTRRQQTASNAAPRREKPVERLDVTFASSRQPPAENALRPHEQDENEPEYRTD